MRFLLVFLLINFLLLAPASACAYPESQFKECLLGVKRSPIILGVPEQSIENFCDCALEKIIDQGIDDKTAGIDCTSKSFG